MGKFGKPTWRRLLEAVEDNVGGNNPAMAQTIAADHPGAPGNHLQQSVTNLCRSSLSYVYIRFVSWYIAYRYGIDSCITCVLQTASENKFL